MARSEPKIAQSSEAGEPRESDLRPPGRSVSFAEAFRFWVKLGFISFGGPAGQIAIMHRELVERRRWLSEERFLHALNGVILNLALVFGATVIWPHELAGGTNWFAVIMSVAAFVALYRFKADVLWVVLGGGLIGLTLALLSG